MEACPSGVTLDLATYAHIGRSPEIGPSPRPILLVSYGPRMWAPNEMFFLVFGERLMTPVDAGPPVVFRLRSY